jgi:hypothetical protein
MDRRAEQRSDKGVVAFERIHPMKLTLEQKTARIRELMNELSQQVVVAKASLLTTRQSVDEMFAEVYRNMNHRQEVIDTLKRETFNE